MSGWENPDNAAYYEAFCARHSRYHEANVELIRQACIAPGMALLDLGAGTGGTAEAALPALGQGGSVLCVEPSAQMRAAGQQRLSDHQVRWSESLPDAPGAFDRIVSGAAIWQMLPLSETFKILVRLLRSDGALCFNIPALYLLEPDEPGGGSDPLLQSLPDLLDEGTAIALAPPAFDRALAAPLSHDGIHAWLRNAGFRAESWRFRLRVTQDAYADWLKIPATAGSLLRGMAARERAQKIDAALLKTDRNSWKWEAWWGWTAWKR